MKRETVTGFLCILVFLVLGAVFHEGISSSHDIGVYKGISEGVASEYPPPATALFTLVATVFSVEEFATGWLSFLTLLLTGTFLYLRRIASEREATLAVAVIVLSTILLGQEVSYARYDIIIGILVLLACIAHSSARFRASGFWLLLASSFKIVPLLLLPLFWCSTPKGERRGVCIGAVVGVIASVGFALIVLGPAAFQRNVEHLQAYHGGRGIQNETTWSSVHVLSKVLKGEKAELVFHAETMENRDLPESAATVVSVLLLLGVAVLTWLLHKQGRGDAASGSTILLLWIFGMSPILSPQFFLWVMPLALFWLFGTRGDEPLTRMELLALSLILFMCLTTQWIFPFHHGRIVAQDRLLENAFLAARNVGIFVLAVLVYVSLSQRERESL